jgi:hypothetical protein
MHCSPFETLTGNWLSQRAVYVALLSFDNAEQSLFNRMNDTMSQYAGPGQSWP